MFSGWLKGQTSGLEVVICVTLKTVTLDSAGLPVEGHLPPALSLHMSPVVKSLGLAESRIQSWAHQATKYVILSMVRNVSKPQCFQLENTGIHISIF